jgi:hypothetical protein
MLVVIPGTSNNEDNKVVPFFAYDCLKIEDMTMMFEIVLRLIASITLVTATKNDNGNDM